jgi:RNA polymerase sigma factor (sigma-70 family)
MGNTTLVLARQAGSIRKPGSLASWLYGVAVRVASKARSAALRRRQGERQAPARVADSALPDAAWRELRALLDEELSRLPERYRAPLVLCYLEGKTNEAAARQLGCTKGTVSSRLARGRDLLRRRLTRRGLALSGGMLVGLFGAGTAPAAVPGTRLHQIIQAALPFALRTAAGPGVSPAAAALARGVLRAMFLNKCKIALMWTLGLALTLVGGGVVTHQVLTGEPAAEAASGQTVRTPEQPPAAQAPAPAGQRDVQADVRKSQENLRHIGIAMHKYHATFGHLPPAAIVSKDGKPLLSWRVALLPFVEQDALFKAFKLDEPWDSPHNKKVLAQMPGVYAPPGVKTAEPNRTFYRVFVGPGTAFEGNQGIRFLDITDGTVNTLTVVEAGQAVPWTKPEELPYKGGQPLPALGGLFGGDFNILMADGSVFLARKNPPARVLHLVIQRNDGMIVEARELKK